MPKGYLDAMLIAARTAREARRQRLATLRARRHAIRRIIAEKEISADALIDDRCVYFPL